MASMGPRGAWHASAPLAAALRPTRQRLITAAVTSKLSPAGSKLSPAAQRRRYLPCAETRLYVQGMPAGATAKELRQAFMAAAGRVPRQVTVPLDRDGVSRGFAFVTIVSGDSDRVFQGLDGFEFQGSTIKVDLAERTKIKKIPDQVKTPDQVARAQALHLALVSEVSVAGLLSIFEAPSFEADHFATALFRVGVLNHTFSEASRPLLHKLLDSAFASLRRDAHTWNSKNLACACHGVATIKTNIGGFEASELFEAASAEALKKVASFNSQHVSQTAWAFSTARVEASDLFAAMAVEATKKMATFTPQYISNTVGAYAKAGVEAPLLFEAAAAEGVKKIAKFDSHALATTARAYATAGFEARPLFEAIALCAVPKVCTFRPADLAQLVWSFATVSVSAPLLFEAVAVEAQKKVGLLDSHDLAKVAWAFATAGVSAPALFTAVAAQALERTFEARGLARIACAFATAQVEAPALFEFVSGQAAPNVAHLTPHHLATLPLAFAKAGFAAPALFEAIAKEATMRIQAFSAKDLSATAAAFSLADFDAPQLFEAISAQRARLRARP
mmetsp:Transcript_15173/g.51982  ORF Transcript_15173/g.51982 Transcript_15173/m.51982 type:complete len:562 (+) Transcript_15173:59-1744(+)